MRKALTQVVAGVAALAVASLALFTSSAQALPPGTAAAGAGTLSPLTGTNLSSFSFAPPSGAVCPGDSSVGGYRWTTFMVASSVDPATLTYNISGPVSQGGAYTQPLYNTSGSAQIAKTTAVSTGLITPIPSAFNFASNTMPVPNGAYNIGYACTLAGVTERFWVTPILISNSTATTFDYSLFAVPGAPTLASPLTAGVSGELSGTFTAPASTPATLSYLVTATPPSGPAITATVTAPATGFTIGGLTNGIAYSVTVRTTNAAGTGAASTAVSGTPFDVNQRPAVTLLPAVPGVNTVALTWVAPTGVAPTGYSITVPGVVGSPFTAAAGATAFTVPALCSLGVLTFTVTPTHTAPFFGSPASLSSTALCDGTLIQDVTVVRPAGALVLTQRCGVYGALPIELATPGFAQLAALPASADQVGSAPALLTVGGAADPQFGNYPNPSAVAPITRCGVDLGTAQYVTSGTLAGQYYAANGRINQVTVSDTRDTDTGWIASATMSDFNVVGGGSTFNGNYLGWTPVVTDDSDLTFGGYNQTATAGATVLPTTAAGLATAKELASTPAGAGLGIATFDARLKLLIPVSARAGTYNGTLTFTVIARP